VSLPSPAAVCERGSRTAAAGPFGRRCRFNSMEAESNAKLSIPSVSRKRCNEELSRPAC